ADTLSLSGEDLNRNGVLDPNESDDNRNGIADPGLLDYVTVYSREPNTRTNGSPRVNVRVLSGSTGPLPDLLRSALNSTRADQILANLGLLSIGPVGPGQIGGGGKPNSPGAPAAPTVVVTLRSPLEFYVRSRMTADE